MVGVPGGPSPFGPAVIVITLGHLALAFVADVVMLIVVATALRFARRSIWSVLPAWAVRAWAVASVNLKRALALGAIVLFLFYVFDPPALIPLVEGAIVVGIVGLLLLLLWGGIVGLALAVPLGLVGYSYRRATRTMREYRQTYQPGYGYGPGSSPGPGPGTSGAGYGGDRPGPGTSGAGYGGDRPGPGTSGAGYCGDRPGGHGSANPPRVATVSPFAAEYSVLGLSGDESPDDVRRAWRRLAFELHPDRHSGDDRWPERAQERLKYVNAAYTVLRQNDLAA